MSPPNHKWAWVFGSKQPPSREVMLVAVAALGLLLIAFFTNPDQAAHLAALKRTLDLRSPEPPLFGLSYVEYNNYVIFSTTTVFDRTVSRGFFGQVRTTDRITVFYQGVLAPP